MTLQRKQQGFTIVELLIVIVVIGILALLVVTTFTGIQQRARNTARETDIRSLHQQLEAFYAESSYYPSNTELNTDEFRQANLRGVDAETYIDPNGTSNQLVSGDAVEWQYGYEGVNCNADDECAAYRLTGINEGSEELIERLSVVSAEPTPAPAP